MLRILKSQLINSHRIFPRCAASSARIASARLPTAVRFAPFSSIASPSTPAPDSHQQHHQRQQQQQQQKHEQQQQDNEQSRKRRRFHHALFPILGAPIFVLGFYTAVRFWPVDDEEAMLHRHSFIAADGNVDLPSTPPQLHWQDDSFTL